MPNLRSLESLRRRVCTIIDIGTADDLISRAYDIFYTLVILVNLMVTIAYTFDEAEAACGPLLLRIEAATVAFFAVDCALRIWTAKYHHPNLKEWKAVCRYIFSFSGIVDLLSFLPYYMPFFFPSGAVALRSALSNPPSSSLQSSPPFSARNRSSNSCTLAMSRSSASPLFG